MNLWFHKAIFACVIFELVCGKSIKQDPCTTEEHRPRYHFSPQRNWINDPNGMVYYNGTYNLYYQYHPDSMVWGPMHWGHTTSTDMVTWTELPIALYPDELGQIFSGSAVVDSGNTTGFKQSPEVDPIVAVYTSAGESQRQSIAYSLDSGVTFTKYEGNPVLSPTETPDFRDPKVSYHFNRWIMALAVDDRIEFYSSQDLKEWAKESEMGRNPPEGNHGGVWECPDLLKLTVDINENESIDLWVLIVSINPGGPNGGSATQYFIGDFVEIDGKLQFQTYPWSENQWLDWGPDNYAGVTFSNEPSGRSIYMGWMTNWLYAADTPNRSHRGQMTVPRQIGIRVINHRGGQYRLTSTPVPELNSLRDPQQSVENNTPFPVPAQTVIHLTENATFRTPLMELEINLEMRNNPLFSICANNDMNEEVCVGYNSTRWYLDRSKSGNIGFHDGFQNTLVSYAASEIPDESTNIRIFLDVSSMEVFTDGGLTTFTSLHFPTQPLDRFYINHWSDADSTSVVTVKNFKLWGLNCWFSNE